MRTEYVSALAALLWCLIINSAAQAESPQINVVPYSTPLPSDSLVGTLSDGPKNSSGNKTVPSTEIPQGVKSRAESRESVAVKNATAAPVFMLPSGAIVTPSGELIGVQNATNSTPITTDSGLATFPSLFFLFATAIGAPTALVWWRKRKNKSRKNSIRRLAREIEHEWSKYFRYEG